MGSRSSRSGSQTSWHGIQTRPPSALVSVHFIMFVRSLQPNTQTKKSLSTKATVPIKTVDSEVCGLAMALSHFSLLWVRALYKIEFTSVLGAADPSAADISESQQIKPNIQLRKFVFCDKGEVTLQLFSKVQILLLVVAAVLLLYIK